MESKPLEKSGAMYLLVALALSGCVSSRITSALTRYGLDPRQARCVGERLESNLSLSQLQQLGRAARAYGKGDQTPGKLAADDLLRVSGQIDDVRIPLEVAKATGRCGVLARTLLGGTAPR
jgi:hypothetical protein